MLDKEGWPTNAIKPKLECDRGANEVNVVAMYSIFNVIISTNEFHRFTTYDD